VRSCLAFSIWLGDAAFLWDGIEGIVDAERMDKEFIRWVAIRSDGNMVDRCAQDNCLMWARCQILWLAHLICSMYRRLLDRLKKVSSVAPSLR